MRTRPATFTRSTAVRHCSASAIRANVIAEAVGCLTERSSIAVGEVAVTPLAFTALLRASQETWWGPMPATGTCAVAPSYVCVGPPSTEQEIAAIPLGPPEATALTV